MVPASDDLPAALGVERRLGELDERAPVVARATPADGGVLLELLVAGEGRRLGRDRAHDVGAAGRPPSDRPRPPTRGALLVHQPRELLVARERHAALGGDLARQLDREAERVVQLEGVGRATARRRRAGRRAAACPARACGRSPPPRQRTHLRIVSRPLTSSGYAGAHRLDHLLDEARQEAALDADPVALLDRAAHDAAQDVAAVLVGGHDAVGDQERHRARVVGEDAQRALVGRLARRELAPERHQRRELVGLEDRRRRPAGSAPCG